MLGLESFKAKAFFIFSCILWAAVMIVGCDLSELYYTPIGELNVIARDNNKFEVRFISEIYGTKSSISADKDIDLAMMRTVIDASVPNIHSWLAISKECTNNIRMAYRHIEANTLRNGDIVLSCNVFADAEIVIMSINKDKFLPDMIENKKTIVRHFEKEFSYILRRN
jgi:hypothetical protein